MQCARSCKAGSPPRARGEAPNNREQTARIRITPACAGRSQSVRRQASPPWDHPRVRGEKSRQRTKGKSLVGSPPRARGEADEKLHRFGGGGITPACAGRSLPLSYCLRRLEDHPRVRGEKLWRVQEKAPCTGSPPRARGEVTSSWGVCDMGWITPACAGRSRRGRTSRRRL